MMLRRGQAILRWLIKNSRSLFLVLIVGLCASQVFADTWSSNNIFTIPTSSSDGVTPSMDKDFSISILQMLFGPVSTVLNGSTAPPINPLISELFRIFNTGVLVMTGILIGYSVLMTTISVSQEGSQAFQGKASPFLIFRIVTGSSLLIPSFGGYSGIQVIVMTCVVQGVGFANTAWVQSAQLLAGAESGEDPTAELSTLTQDAIKYNLLMVGQNSQSKVLSGMSALDGAWQIEVNNGSHCQQDQKNTNNLTAIDLFSMAMCVKFAEQTNAYANSMAQQTGANTANYNFNAFYQNSSQTSGPCSSTQGTYLCFGQQPVDGANSSNNTALQTLCGKVNFAADSDLNLVTSAVSQAFSAANYYTNNISTFIDSSCDALTQAGQNEFFNCSAYNPDNNPNVCNVGYYLNQIADAYATSLISGVEGSSSSGSDPSSIGINTETGWSTAGQYFNEITLAASTGSATSSSSTGVPDTSQYTAHIGTIASDVTAYNNTTNNGSMTIASPYCQKCLCFVDDITGNSTNVLCYNKYWQAIFDPYSFYGIASNGQYPTGATQYPYWYQYAAGYSTYDNYQSASQTASNAGGGSTAADVSNDAQSQAGCQAAQQIFNAATGLADLPAYLTESNVVNPWNIFTAFGNGASVSDWPDPSGVYKLDVATTNMMISMLMSLEALTGLRILGRTINTQSDYEDLGNESDLVNGTCKSFPNCSTDTSTANFYTSIAGTNCLKMPSNGTCPTSTDLDKAGLYGMMAISLGAYDTVCEGTQLYPDPIRNLTNVGVTMLRAAVLYYIVTMQQIFENLVSITLTAVGIVSGVKIGLAIANAALGGNAEGLFVGAAALVDSIFELMFKLDKYALELFLPLGSAVAGLLFVQGVTLGVYLPFLAFFYYTFGVLGWTVAVIEAMVAAPLVAMGVTHPEGHDLLGQSEQALMLLLGVFLRPICMVIGLFFAISLSHAVMNLINNGFLFVMLDFFNTLNSTNANSGTIGSKVTMICTLGLFLVYSYVVFQVLDMCYGLIYQIPDKILRWIGGPQDNTGQMVASAVSQIKGQTSQMAQAGASGAGQASSKTADTSGKSSMKVGGAGGEDDGDDGGDSVEEEGDNNDTDVGGGGNNTGKGS